MLSFSLFSISNTLLILQIVNVEASQVCYFGTKVEIKMKKAEILSWSKLGRVLESQNKNVDEEKTIVADKIIDQVEAVDLSDL